MSKLPKIPTLEELVKAGEESLKEKASQFLNESGRALAMLIFLLISALASGNLINSQIIEIILAIITIIAGFFVYVFVHYWNKRGKQFKSDFMGLAFNHMKLGDKFTDLHNDCGETKVFLEVMKLELKKVKDDNNALAYNFNEIAVMVSHQRETNEFLDHHIKRLKGIEKK